MQTERERNRRFRPDFKAQSPWAMAEEHAEPLRKMPIRQAIGDQDEISPINRNFHEHLVALKIPHTFTLLPGVGHQPLAVLQALGEANWDFYRQAFFPASISPQS